jgi:hypothetical protein
MITRQIDGRIGFCSLRTTLGPAILRTGPSRIEHDRARILYRDALFVVDAASHAVLSALVRFAQRG